MIHRSVSLCRVRKSFGSIREVIDIPNLIEIQRSSYDGCLNSGGTDKISSNLGLKNSFLSVFPIRGANDKSVLEFVRYTFDKPKYGVEECRQRGMTYSAPLRVSLRLIVYEVDDDETGSRSVKDIKEQDVHFGDFPLMTDSGTFIINGTERVVISQVHRSPGVFFDHDHGKTNASGKFLYAARVISYHGSWLDFEFDSKDIVHVRIDRRRKFPVTTFLYALGMSQEEICREFYSVVSYEKVDSGWKIPFDERPYKGIKLQYPVIDADTGEVLAEEGDKLTARKIRKMVDAGLSNVIVPDFAIYGNLSASDLIDESTGVIHIEAGAELTPETVELVLEKHKIINVLDIDPLYCGPYIRDTIFADKNMCLEDALLEIYRVMRPGEPPVLDGAKELFKNLFFISDRYDLSDIGRVKLNMRLGMNVPDTERTLSKQDILNILRVLVGLRDGIGDVDDIDHLGNRRIRSVGELMDNQFRLGLLRVEKTIRERMSAVDIDTVMPLDLVNVKPVTAAIREFFGSSQLSQFMDQTNPLSEVTHKRRLSALGPGGLTRERAGFEVRDVHPTHYGRMCPIETPEGPNIGLINSLATFARVNKYGFIETPYRKVIDQCVSDEIVYLSAAEEHDKVIAQANAVISDDGRLIEDLVSCRKGGDFLLSPAAFVDLMDVSPKQVVSVAASLIPFLENDDANRALMGSNMQRQAVPLIRSEAPFVGTGMEALVAKDSGAAITARRGGIIEQVDATRIVVRVTDDTDFGDPGIDIYRLRKYQRSNQSTCINQRPLVKVGDFVAAGRVIADGPSTDMGELALGMNVLVGFMPWNGYNFEDSILISERIVRDDVFTSIHIEEYEVVARDTKLGAEEITRDVPNVGDDVRRHLDESGIVYLGAKVSPGDVLVGKITPKGESPMTPEEKLLRAIFGEKSMDVRDTSLRMPSGDYGTVVGVKVFNRHGIEKDERSLQIERESIDSLTRDRDDEHAILKRNVEGRMRKLLDGQSAANKVGSVVKGGILTADVLDTLSFDDIMKIVPTDEEVLSHLEALRDQFTAARKFLNQQFEEQVEKVQRGDDLVPGVMKMVRVYVAVKRKLQPGDKMAGRHGNKGVISKVVPVEDMPFLEDGTPLDVVLNPLGVPSRMNVGQILETHLGLAAAGCGKVIDNALHAIEKSISSSTNVSVDDGALDFLVSKMSDFVGSDKVKEILDESGYDGLLSVADDMRKGVHFATPVFDGAKEHDISSILSSVGFDASGQMKVYDGRSGDAFDRKVTVGYKYLLKLHHLVDDKIHARSTGPYSLVTQQPLGGKAQFGGQRFGEMEVWALEAYGAAYTLQELLTVKSDDVAGRTKVYESIVRGSHGFETGIPESFNVLIKEIRSLALNIDLVLNENSDEDGSLNDSDLIPFNMN